jgi:hypothetical protein
MLRFEVRGYRGEPNGVEPDELVEALQELLDDICPVGGDDEPND